MEFLDIYLVRHGQTVFNVQEKVQGHNDSPLTAEGIYQGRCTGAGLRDIPFVMAYSGDLGRQYDTARAVLSENRWPDVEIRQYPFFREMCYGRYQEGSYYDMLNQIFESIGVPYGGYEELSKYLTARQIALFLQDTDEAMETCDQVARRMIEGLDTIVRENPEGGNVLVATSSMAIDDVIEALFPGFIHDQLVQNGSVTVIRHDGDGYHLISYNDVSWRDEGAALLEE